MENFICSDMVDKMTISVEPNSYCGYGVNKDEYKENKDEYVAIIKIEDNKAEYYGQDAKIVGLKVETIKNLIEYLQDLVEYFEKD
jgi:hypothetical protein